MMKKMILILLLAATVQLQGMEQFRKLKTNVLKKYYKIDNVWGIVFGNARSVDFHKQKGLHPAFFLYKAESAISDVEILLSRIYGQRVRFAHCKRHDVQNSCCKSVREVYEELEGKKAPKIVPMEEVVGND